MDFYCAVDNDNREPEVEDEDDLMVHVAPRVGPPFSSIKKPAVIIYSSANC